ncbi:MAG: hypothetical protein KatS3mg008_0554 [Acidimicrobiales bacterium]|nr:MAG: hypothetical protein KatS3mg008_0554 [Acidimicrobiales bacterium]
MTSTNLESQTFSARPSLVHGAASRIDELRRPTITVIPWPDPVVEELGHDPRSWYVERFWLPVLGPSTVLLLRLLNDELDDHPDGTELEAVEVAGALGLSWHENVGKNSPFVRTLLRSCQFGFTRICGEGTLAVRRAVPDLPRRHLRRLPTGLQKMHAEWMRRRLSSEPPDPAAA